MLATAIFFLGIAITYGDTQPDLTGPFDFLGMFMMLTGAVQMAFIVGGTIFPHTPPALEAVFAHERTVMWLFAPLMALVGILLALVYKLATGTP
jgi:hypothetical protein